MLESGQYIIRDFASDHYVGRSTFEENNWDPKIIYDLDDLEVLCSGYPLVSSRVFLSKNTFSDMFLMFP